ncbi:esterase/lipase family protein [Cellulomonas gilvus]|uniref:DUF676 domain-containing protein n=1 Tax=Cellulomonas gilvus (strain ATCC 13127 / NRRL B-14078) TaxID=593907 RepID=F8A5N3_CELGA|nr:alpha/beta hydrolase [Cellulomonas gilvus]AEI12188.1 hypothetical protein Celgi_1677 [Cellulomonas gilvus ATCC 13127]
MAYDGDGRLPVVYVRGYAGGPSGIDKAVDDPFYGFNEGSVQVRVDGADRPAFHQFESPLLRLMIDHGYQLLVRGDQEAYLRSQEPGTVPAATIWVHRFYDEFAPHLTRDPNAFSIERASASLFDLVQAVRRQTGAPRVFLVAHSMGGLVVRGMLQRVIPDDEAVGGTLDAAAAFVDRVFTYATPHGGIEFAVGFGLLEKARDLLGVQGADIFGPRRMREYLSPTRVPVREEFDAQRLPAGGFPLDRFFCLVGTNAGDYTSGLGLPARAVGPRSDGLVQIDNAYVRGAPRAYVHRSHSGRFGIVNSEEGYQNLRRFLFGDLEVRADLTDVELPGTPDDDTAWQLEVAMSIRGLPVVLHEQSTAHLCPIQVERPVRRDASATPVPLIRTYLSSSATRPPDPRTGTRAPTMRHVLRLRLMSLRSRGGLLSFLDHLEQAEDWADVLVVDIQEDGGTRRTWARWGSELGGAIRDWAPDPERDEALADDDPAPGAWRSRVPLPPAARALLGESAAVTIAVHGRATLDRQG